MQTTTSKTESGRQQRSGLTGYFNPDVLEDLEECQIEEHDILGGSFCRGPRIAADEDMQNSEAFFV